MGNAAAGWTPERRKKHSEAIRGWQPWSRSTGPKSAEGRARVSRNAWTGGHRVTLRQLTKELNQALRAQRGWLTQ